MPGGPQIPARAHYCICAVTLLLWNTAVFLVKLAWTLSLGETITAPFGVLREWKKETERGREREQGFIERGERILRIILIIKHPQLSLYLTVRVWVAVFIGFHLLFVQCVCVHVFVCSLRPSSAVWSGVQMAELGPAERDTPFSFLSFFLSLYRSSFPFLPSFLLFSPFQPFLLGFIYQLHPWLPPLFHHCICWGPSWAEESFPLLYFLSRSFFMRLSGLSAAAIRGGFGMKCLLTEPCAPELR